jgi:hypothetical protein
MNSTRRYGPAQAIHFNTATKETTIMNSTHRQSLEHRIAKLERENAQLRRRDSADVPSDMPDRATVEQYLRERAQAGDEKAAELLRAWGVQLTDPKSEQGARLAKMRAMLPSTGRTARPVLVGRSLCFPAGGK